MPISATSQLVLFVNGRKHVESNADPEMTLLRYLREILGLKGTKLGCGVGGCGACTVVIGRLCARTGRPIHYSVNACITPLCSVHLKHVITVEGIGNVKRPHAIQAALASYHASQCGFCTPGFVMSLYALLRNNPSPSERELEEAFDGNLCRCTGYRPILEAAKPFACQMGDGCCRKSRPTSEIDECRIEQDSLPLEYDPTQEILFPPELSCLLKKGEMKLSVFRGPRVKWIMPVKKAEVMDVLKLYPTAKLVNGNTEVGLEAKLKKTFFDVQVFLGNVEDLRDIYFLSNGIQVGSTVTLCELQQALKREIEKFKDTHLRHQTRSIEAVETMLKWFAGNQIRNVATWVGNVVTASPISDLTPILMVCDAQLTIQSKNSLRRQSVRDFVTGYRRTTLSQGDLVTSIFIPFNGPNEYIRAYKQAKRREDDITVVGAAFNLLLHTDTSSGLRVSALKIAFAGVGPTIVIPKAIMKLAMDLDLSNEEDVKCLEAQLDKDIPVAHDTPGGFPEYRKSLLGGLLRKFVIDLQEDVKTSSQEESFIPLRSIQFSPEPDPALQVVGQAKQHLSGLKHTTGEAVYCDDIPRSANELYAGLVLSEKPSGWIMNIDYSEALSMEGVFDVVTAADVPGQNKIGPVVDDEEIFVSKRISSTGQLVAMILADTKEHAQRAAAKVRVEMKPEPFILTIDEAIQAESFFPDANRSLVKGDVEGEFGRKDLRIVEGEVRIGGQEHFYLETQAALVIPLSEDEEFEVISSTQNPTEAQKFVARVLDIPENRIVCKVRRIGGGFGGKETRASFLAAAVAVASQKTRRPVRCMMDRDEDIQFSGQRHSFLGQYKVAVDPSGLIQAVDVQMWSNGGHSLDLSQGVMDRAVSHFDNCYHFPTARIRGRICRTNTPSNTAFRGFGGPQGMFICESMMDHIARDLGLPCAEVRQMNLYQSSGQETPFHMIMEDCTVRRMWTEEMPKLVNLNLLRQEIVEFNAANKYRKRGMALIPTKFGIAFGVKFMNQAGALVHLLSDGSVQISHGGVEMGQGIHTKMIQIVAEAFNLPMSSVHFSETNTAIVANTSASAASATSDLNGMALLDACRQLKERLREVWRDLPPDASFRNCVQEAYKRRIDLSARGFFATPNIGYDWVAGTGRLFNYFTYGMAVSTVELDCLTGDHRVLSSDIVMDLGRSLNPAIDIGQIEGAFVQGQGLFTLEELHWSPAKGCLLTRDPGAYKIPSAGDIPRQFRVHLLPCDGPPHTPHSSRAVGEPPLFLAASIFFALKDALYAARTGPEYFRLDSPATMARLRMAIDDDTALIARQSVTGDASKPWMISI